MGAHIARGRSTVFLGPLKSFIRCMRPNSPLLYAAFWVLLSMLLLVTPALAVKGVKGGACQVPDQAVKLSDCIGTDANRTVIIGGSSGTGQCTGAAVNA